MERSAVNSESAADAGAATVAIEFHDARYCGFTRVKPEDLVVQKWERKSNTQDIAYQGWSIRHILRIKNGKPPSRLT